MLAGSEQADQSGIRGRLDFRGVNAIARPVQTASQQCHDSSRPDEVDRTIAFALVACASHACRIGSMDLWNAPVPQRPGPGVPA